MKRAVLPYFIVATLMASCGKSGYSVNGTVSDIADGTYAYLYSGTSRSAQVVDSAKVGNGTFCFKGNQEQAEMRKISCGKLKAVIVLENASLNLDLQNGICSGSALNDIYAGYLAKNDSLNAQMNVLRDKMGNPSLSEEEAKAIDKEGERIYDEMNECQARTTKENIQNCVGAYLFSNTFYILSDEENEALIAQIPEQFRDERVKKFEDILTVRRKTAVGQPFIDFTMNDPEGTKVSLGQYVKQNKYTLVDFWASWCGPCRAEMPNVVAAYAQYKDKGFGIVGVSLDRDLDSWKKAIEALDITWPQMSDLKYWDCAGSAAYGVSSIPSTVLIRQDGVIVERNLRGEEIAKKLEELLAQ